MYALGEQRVVVAEGVGRDFARTGHDAGLLQGLVVLEEKVGREHAHAAVDEFLEFGSDGAVGQAGRAFAGVIQPDDHFARRLGRLEPIDGDFFAEGRVLQAALGAEVGIAPLRTGVREGDLADVGIGPTDDGLDGGAKDGFAPFGGLGGGDELSFGVGLQPAEQSAFELRVAGLRRRMGLVPDRQFSFGSGW